MTKRKTYKKQKLEVMEATHGNNDEVNVVKPKVEQRNVEKEHDEHGNTEKENLNELNVEQKTCMACVGNGGTLRVQMW